MNTWQLEDLRVQLGFPSPQVCRFLFPSLPFLALALALSSSLLYRFPSIRRIVIVMDVSLIAETLSVATNHGLGFAKFLLRRPDILSSHNISISYSILENSFYFPASGVLKISAVIFPVDVLAPPAVKSSSYRTAPRTLLRIKRRTRRRSYAGDSEDGEDEEFGGDGGDGPYGGAGEGGGRGWNFDRFGWNNWDEPSSSSSSDPALDFVYEVMCWIALSNCVHFAFKKIIRFAADGIGGAEREKMPLRLTSLC